jgi:hypothetical protein
MRRDGQDRVAGGGAGAPGGKGGTRARPPRVLPKWAIAGFFFVLVLVLVPVCVVFLGVGWSIVGDVRICVRAEGVASIAAFDFRAFGSLLAVRLFGSVGGLERFSHGSSSLKFADHGPPTLQARCLHFSTGVLGELDRQVCRDGLLELEFSMR